MSDIHLKNIIKSGLNFIRDNNVFVFNEGYYKQLEQIPTSVPISGPFAEIELDHSKQEL